MDSRHWLHCREESDRLVHLTISAAFYMAVTKPAIPAFAHAAVSYNGILLFPRHFESLLFVLPIPLSVWQKHINGLSQNVTSRPDLPRHHEALLTPDIACLHPSALRPYSLFEGGFSAPWKNGQLVSSLLLRPQPRSLLTQSGYSDWQVGTANGCPTHFSNHI